MPDDIADLTELMDTYRRRSKSVPFRPVAAAYAEAADDLQEMLVELEAGRPVVPDRPVLT